MWTKILGGMSAILAFTVLILRGRIKEDQIKELKRDAAESKAEEDYFEKADEAIAEAIEDENNTDNDNYFTK